MVIMLCVLFAILINTFIFKKVQPDSTNGVATFTMSMMSDENIGIQVFYSTDTIFTEEMVEQYLYDDIDTRQDVSIQIPIDTQYIRIDLGDIVNNTKIYNAVLEIGNKQIEIDLEKIASPVLTSCIQKIVRDESGVSVTSDGVDPYIVVSLEDIDMEKTYHDYYGKRYFVYDILLCLIVDLVLLLCIVNMRKLAKVPLTILYDRSMVWDLARNDFQARFAGSYLGVIWAFIQPVVTMLLYWFVFQVGLRAGNVSDYPFILFLMSGMIPWFYFSEVLNGGTNVLMEYSYLVKKVVFEIDILPVIKTISAIFVHLFFITFIIVMCAIYGYTPDMYTLQIIYYIICTCVLVTGLSYITSACAVFFRDTAQVINIILTMGVWITPIMWNPADTLSPGLQMVFRANPVYYIVDGFRDALLAKVWFWDKPVWTIYFWVLSVIIYIIGINVFNRLKPHFSDVL